jgi:hypothetical protein
MRRAPTPLMRGADAKINVPSDFSCVRGAERLWPDLRPTVVSSGIGRLAPSQLLSNTTGRSRGRNIRQHKRKVADFMEAKNAGKRIGLLEDVDESAAGEEQTSRQEPGNRPDGHF